MKVDGQMSPGRIKQGLVLIWDKAPKIREQESFERS